MKNRFRAPGVSIERLGVVAEPNGDEREKEGLLNPASAIDRDGNLLLYPRVVAAGNESRVGIIRVAYGESGLKTERLGYALEPECEYELNGAVGQGCEDARVTFVEALDVYLMAYTAYGKNGPRAAAAYSRDGYQWMRLGLIHFPAHLNLHPDDKDVAFFPEPVLSPQGVESIALYHRPMVDIPPEGGLDAIKSVLARPARERQSIRIAYVPLALVQGDIRNITSVKESVRVLSPGSKWGRVKLGGGTPPVRIEEGLLSLYHGVDAFEKEPGKYAMRYSAGLMIHDARDPHKVLYHSLAPLFKPDTVEELSGIVNNVVFPTALVPRDDLGARIFDVYYGMADYRIGLIRLRLGQPRKQA